MNAFIKCALCAVTVLFHACASEPAKPQPRETESFNLAEKQLLEIVDTQKYSLDYIARTPNISQGELKSKLREIELLWAEYIRKNPKDVHALILYGKFLRTIQDPLRAYETFKHADSINPNIAVVKQQLATYEGEIKEYNAAYKNLKKACELEPKTTVYHSQLADLLYLAGPTMIKNGDITADSCETETLNAYKTALSCDPKNKALALRYAQSFYNAKNPNWNDALSAWNKVIQLSPLIHEKDSARIHKGRVLIILNQPISAKKELDLATSKHKDPELLSLLLQANSMIDELNKDTATNKKTFSY